MLSKLSYRIILIIQINASIGIIVFMEGSFMQTILLFILWGATFYPLSANETTLFILTCFFFTISDIMVIQKGVFEFTTVDVFGLPLYEPFAWGLYFLHTSRMLGYGRVTNPKQGILFAIAFIFVLSLIENTIYMLSAASLIIIIACTQFRVAKDFAYMAYLLGLGLLIESLGTKFGVWHYNISHHVWWWVVTWAASGLILHRAVQPLSIIITEFLRSLKNQTEKTPY